MNKKEENILTPKLRFPQFQKAGEWQRTTIGEVGKFYYGKSAPKWSLSNDAPTLCVRYGELYTKFDTIIKEVFSRTNIDPSNLRFSKGGEILIPRVGEVPQDFAKNCCYLPFPDIAIGEMISVYETEEYPIFYAYYFRTMWKQFAEVVEGQNVKNLYYINLEPIVVGKPIYKEQQKIADCLSSIDELITAHIQKLDALKAHKNGLMQQLFPADGETAPRLGFKELLNRKKWEEKSLGSICRDIASGKDRRDSEGKYNLFGSTGIIGKTGSNSHKGNYILVARVGANAGLLNRVSGEFGVTDNTLVIYLNESENLNFIYYSLDSINLSNLVFGSGQPLITGSQLKNLFINMPEPDEQQKIADCLLSLDDLITVQDQKIETLKFHKKGLLQGLFPEVNEISK